MRTFRFGRCMIMCELFQKIKHIIIMTIKQSYQLTKHPFQSLNQSRIDSMKYYQMAHDKLNRSLEKMINISTKTSEAYNFLKKEIFHIQNESQEQKQDKKTFKKFLRNQAISHLQQHHEKFFIPTLEMKSHEKGSTLQVNRSVDEQQSSIVFEQLKQTEQNISPLESLKNTMYKNANQKSKSFKQVTNQSNMAYDLTSKIKNRQITSTFKSQIRKSNTYLFSLPSKMSLKKKITIKKSQIVYKWQEGLMEVMNRLQGTKIKFKDRLKLEKEKLSQHLKKYLINQVITSYYQCTSLISFSQLKKMVVDLMTLTKRQASLLTFFTYDINNDGFICEEDIYAFIQKLSHKDRIMEDFNLIIQFLRKNKVRSTEINLPKKLLSNKSKKAMNQNWNQNKTCSIKSIRQKHKHKLAKKFFSLLRDSEEDNGQEKQIPFYKKFQINFDVFNLIFAEKRSTLIKQIIRRLTEDAQQNFPKIIEEIGLMKIKTQPTQQFLYTRSEEWKFQMERSQHLRSMAQQVKNSLTYTLQ